MSVKPPEEAAIDAAILEALDHRNDEAVRQLAARYLEWRRGSEAPAERPPLQLVREQHLDSLIEYAAGTVDLLGWRRTPASLLHTASITLVSAIMGKVWAFEVYARTPAVIQAPRPGEGDAAYVWIAKTWRLADTIFAVHRLENISDRLCRMRGPDLESTLAELSIIERLRWSSPVWLRPEVVGGHDADMMLDDGLMCAMEIKCRLEATEHSHAGVLSRLKKARKQLPRDRPSLVWVRYPSTVWRPDTPAAPGASSVMQSAAREFLRNTGTVSAVVFSSEFVVRDLPEQRRFLTGASSEIFVNDTANPPESLRRLLQRVQRFTVRDGVLVAPVLRFCRAHGISLADDLPPF